MDMLRLLAACGGTLTGLVTANYLYQALGARDWAAATERSFFQAAALAALLFVAWATKKIDGRQQ